MASSFAMSRAVMKPIPLTQPDHSEHEQGHEQQQEDMVEHTHSPLETDEY